MTYFLILWWLVGTLPPLALLWALWQLALRPERCFGYNRALLLLAPVLAAAWALLPHPASLGPAFQRFTVTAPNMAGPMRVVVLPALYARPADVAFWNGWPWLVALYAAGVALGLAWLAWRYGQLHRATRRLPREARAGYVLARTGGQLPTSSFGRTVYWDETANLTPAEAAPVLAHELTHVRQGHSYDVLWLELWRVVLWPNPFAHLLLPALRLTHELLADRAALAGTAAEAGPAGYPALLARLATRQLAAGHSLLLQPFHFSFTLTRIAMLRTTHPVRRWKQWLPLPLLGTAFLVACQTTPDLQSVAPPPPPPPPLLIKNSEMADSKVDADKLYTYVEQMPTLPGTNGNSNAAIVAAILAKLVYPKGEQPEGKVFASFTVGADGVVRDVRLVKGLSPACDEAVLNAVRQLPTFIPGQQNGTKVNVSFTVPVLFKAQP